MSLRHRFISLFVRRPRPTALAAKPQLAEPVMRFLRNIPKAEIHFHFEGAVSADTVYRLGRKYDVDEIRTRNDAEWCLYFTNAAMFFERFLYASSLFREPEDFYHAALDLGRRLNEENIRYIEITLAPHKFVRNGVPYPALMEAIERGLLETADERRREHRYIIDVVRDLGPAAGLEMLRMVQEHPHPRVAAVGLGGGEQYTPAESVEVFHFAESIGLNKTAHAGEGRGPQSIWDAIQQLGVRRIDHGVRAREDAKLVDYLAEQKISLNLCPTSNVILGVVPSLEDHPIRQYHERGIPVNVSTDDPTFFKVTLTEEYAKLIEFQRFTPEEIPALIENALRASFLDEAEKDGLIGEFWEEMKGCLERM